MKNFRVFVPDQDGESFIGVNVDAEPVQDVVDGKECLRAVGREPGRAGEVAHLLSYDGGESFEIESWDYGLRTPRWERDDNLRLRRIESK